MSREKAVAYPGIRRIDFLIWMVGLCIFIFVTNNFLEGSFTVMGSLVIASIIISNRLVNIGYPASYFLLSFIPFANLAVLGFCLFKGEGRALQKKSDKYALAGLIILMLVAVIADIIWTLSLARSS
jgi:hypothetical protein